MPANPDLTDLEIAEILTYIGNTWGNGMGGFTLEEVQDKY
jgi:cytochrome c551